MLDGARTEKYGKDYWKATGSGELEAMLALDRMCHVPNDATETIKFANVVQSFATTLVTIISKTHEVLRPPQSKPNGSFVNDTKVGDIDDFNYICIVNPSI